MRWPWSKKKARVPTDECTISFDRDEIALNDPSDPTSLLMQLAMRGSAARMNWNSEAGEWVVTVNEQTFAGPTQTKALTKALEANP